MQMVAPDRQPCTSVLREQASGGGGPGAAGGIIGEIAGRSTRPGLNQSLNGAPGRLDRIGPLEQHGVADQAVVDQRLVADRGQRREIVPISEIHLNPLYLYFVSGSFQSITL